MKNGMLAVIDRLYETIESPDSWGKAMAEISVFFNAMTGMVATPTAAQRHSPFYVDYNHAPEAAEAYAHRYYAHDVFRKSAIEQDLFKVGDAILGDALIPHKELRKSVFYNEFLLPTMNAEFYLGAVVSDSATDDALPPLFISFFRSPKQVEFTQSDVLCLRQIVPHLRRAKLLQCTLEALSHERTHFAQTFDAWSQPILLLAPDGRLLHANEAGQQRLQLWQRQRQRLVGPWPKEVARLVKLAGQGQVAADRLIEGDNQCVVVAYPLGERNAHILQCRPASVMLLIVDAHQPSTQVYHALALAYGLTAAEIRLLPLLAQARKPSEMAQILRVDLSTIRSQLSAIYSKFGLRSQQDVIAMLGRFPSLH